MSHSEDSGLTHLIAETVDESLDPSAQEVNQSEEDENKALTSDNISVRSNARPVPPEQKDDPNIPTAGLFPELREDKPFNESNLFGRLEHIFDSHKMIHDDMLAEGETPDGETFVIHKVLNDFVRYKRVASVYTRNMHSMFVVPVWAAAYEQRSNTGYILQPKLTSLTEVLDDVKDKNPYDKEEVLRTCFMSVAMAVDGLYTDVPGVRPVYYHRDVCLENVYVQSTIHKTRGKYRTAYGLARLQLTRNTRGSHKVESLPIGDSKNNKMYPLGEKYFHHPDPWSDNPSNHEEMGMYYMKHDWFSFGVYMLKVIGRLLGQPMNPGFPKVDIYKDYGKKLQDKVNEGLQGIVNEGQLLGYYKEYLDVAMSCINMEEWGMKKDIEYEFTNSSNKRHLHHFDYPLCGFTAHLLCLYDHSGCAEMTLEDVLMERTPMACRACLLRPTAGVPTKSYKLGASANNDSSSEAKAATATSRVAQCDISCNRYYCHPCYVNGERLFCLRGFGRESEHGHGTTSSVLGHQSSYAIILYGQHFSSKNCNRELFKNDAEMLSNVLKHRLICGMPKENILLRPLYSEGKTAERCLEDACNDMWKMIHCRRWNPATKKYETFNRCVNDSDFCVFVFYSGHGGNVSEDLPPGTWVTSVTLEHETCTFDSIRPQTVKSCLRSIRECRKETLCKGSCVEVKYLLDHCIPGDITKILNSLSKWSESYERDPSRMSVTGKVGEKTHTTRCCGTRSELTRWFCNLMRSLFCVNNSKDKDDCTICTDVCKHIRDKCYSSYIDGDCLKLYERHLTEDECKTEADIAIHVSKDDNVKQIILAYYNPRGVHHRIYPYDEADDLMTIDFVEAIHCDSLLKLLKAKVGDRADRFSLLTNIPSDSSKFTLVCDHSVHNILHSTSKVRHGDDDERVYPSILYYQFIKNPVTVHLTALDEGDSADNKPLTEQLVICLDSEYLDMKISEMNKNIAGHVLPNSANQLPNVLVYIVHHLRHLYAFRAADDVATDSDAAHQEADESIADPFSPKRMPTWNRFPTQIKFG